MKTTARKKNKPSSRVAQRSTKSSVKATKTRQRTKKASPKKEKPDEDKFKELFNDLLKDTLNAEKQLVRALPKMVKAATSKQLASAFKKHLSETEKQVSRLEKVFSVCGFKVVGKKCEAMEGLVKEGEEAIKETTQGSFVRDVALIVAAQKVEHYEMAAYGSLRSIAETLGYSKAVDLLQKTLDEEGAADKALTELSASINAKAAGTTGSKVQASASDQEEEEEEPIEEAVYLDADEEEEGDQRSDRNMGNSL